MALYGSIPLMLAHKYVTQFLEKLKVTASFCISFSIAGVRLWVSFGTMLQRHGWISPMLLLTELVETTEL